MAGFGTAMIAPVDRAPEVTHRSDGEAVANFAVAHQGGRLEYRNLTEVLSSVAVTGKISHEISVVGKLAEICAKHLTLGQEIEIQGELRTRMNAEGKRERFVFAEAIYFADAPPEVQNSTNVVSEHGPITVTRWLKTDELPEGVRRRFRV